MRTEAMRPHLASLVEDFRRNGPKTAVVAHRGVRRYPTTYAQLAQLAGCFAAELDRRGLVPGDRVVLWGENSAEWIAVFFGCLLRGVLIVPLDAAGAPSFAARVLADTTPKLLVADPHLLRSLPPAPATTPQLPLYNLATHLPAQPNFAVSPAVTEQTPFQIVFTSGTTSEPRGIVHTHRNILVTLQPIENEIAKYRRYARIVHPLRFLHTLPLSHVFGQFMGLWIPAVLAAQLHFSDQLEPSRIAALLRRERISLFIAVPRILDLLRAHLLTAIPELRTQLAAPPFPSTGARSILDRWWRFRRVHRALGWKFWAVLSGGASLPAELEAFWNRLGYAVIQGYGLTETAAVITLNHPFHIAQGTIGKPLPGREVRIAEDGEVLVRGDMISTATWSGGRLQPRPGEWLATGDLAEQSPAGDLRFLGRKGDVIVTAAGMNIHPADLERALAAQPGVRAVAVVPCTFPTGPEAVAVLLTSSPEADALLQAAVANANRTLAEYQQIRRVLRWPQLEFPYTSTGKLLRRQIAQWACATLEEQRAAPGASADLSANSTTDPLLALIAEITGEPIDPTHPPLAANAPERLRLSEDLHLDSLGRVQLQSALEQRLGLELPDDTLAQLQTLAQLRTAVEAASVQVSALSPVQATPPNSKNEDDVILSAAKDPEAARPTPTANSFPPQSSPAITLGAPGLASETWESSHPRSQETNPQPATHNLQQNTYPHWPWSPPIAALRVVFQELIIRPLTWFLAAPRVTRPAEPLPNPPLLLIANHLTAYDGALALYALPFHLRRRVAIAMSGEMLLDLRHGRNQPNPLANLLAPIGYLLVTALFNVFPLPRARGFRASFAHAGEALDRGYSVLIFPEGTRSRDGRFHAFRPGIGLLAAEANVPILPIALAGLAEIQAGVHAQPRQPKPRWFRSGRLEVRIGHPLPAAADQPGDPTPATVTAVLEQAVRTLLAPSNQVHKP